MASENLSSGITKEFLEKATSLKIESFSVKPGSNIGDNYTSILYSIEIHVVGAKNPLHLLLKCYPEHTARKQFLNDTNLFLKELLVYKEYIPGLRKIIPDCEELKKKLKPAVPPLVHGHAIDYRKINDSEENSPASEDIFANYLLMVDVRKTWGFKMGCRYTGLDYDHVKLIVKELAKLHALSWALRVKNNGKSLVDLYPFFQESLLCAELKDVIEGMTVANFKLVQDALAGHLGQDSDISKGLSKFEANPFDCFLKCILNDGDEVMDMLRIKPEVENNNILKEAWKVGNHGDSWVNNMLFRYDEVSEKPVEAIMVDLQICREACPTIDLSYFFYTSTTSSFRTKHLQEMLEFYSDTFLNYCKLLEVKPLPGFCSKELKRRFHGSKIFGLLSAIMVLPIILQEKDNAVDMDTIKVESNGDNGGLSEMFSNLAQTACTNTLLLDRFLGMTQELYDEGVI